MQPLSGNHTNSDSVNLDYIVRQKKRFHFKKWEAEIGGDICVAHSIKLQGRTYTVFLNGDAMGKSIQGAGGVLVLGAVFEANIERTRLSSDAQSQTPERWLKNSFVDFQKVFESFDGSMFISMLFGLVEDATGTLYFINAEHPHVVLYRDDSAEFLGGPPLRKAGFTPQEEVTIEVHSLLPGDVLFIGSDGKDDLFVGVDEQNRRIINEDERMFINSVEKAQASLQGTFELLTNHGELADDLSIMRIGYRETAAESGFRSHPETRKDVATVREMIMGNDYRGALEVLESAYVREPRHPVVLKNLIKVLGKLKQFDRAAVLSEEYMHLRPGDTDLLMAAAFSAYKSGRTNDAVEWGEQVRLRRPRDTRNLSLLEKLYESLGNAARVQTLRREQEQLAREVAEPY